jgi:hypothetical protein
MRWRIDVTGTKSGVAKQVTEQLDQIAAGFEGKEVVKDVIVAKERILALVAGTKSGGEAKQVMEQLDQIAASLEGKEVAKDVIVAKERILALVAAVDFNESTGDTVKVKAAGVHSINEHKGVGIIEAHMAISVVRTSTRPS